MELSEHALHQDQLNRAERLNGDKRLDGLNTESNAVKDQTVYYDIRFKATLPESKEPVQLIINLEIQLNDTPGYPLVTDVYKRQHHRYLPVRCRHWDKVWHRF